MSEKIEFTSHWTVKWNDNGVMETGCADPGKTVDHTTRMLGQAVANWYFNRLKDANLEVNEYLATMPILFLVEGVLDILRLKFVIEPSQNAKFQA